jgi:hypothetical protein
VKIFHHYPKRTINNLKNTPKTLPTPRTVHTMADLTWKERIDKYSYGIDLTAIADPAELDEYVATRAYLYEQEDFMDDSLWCMFQEDFEGFTVDSFQRMRTDSRVRLRKLLLQRGVYIQTHNKALSISQALHASLQEYDQHQWTDQELAETADKVEILSISLRRRLTGESIKVPAVTAVQQPVTPPYGQSQPVHSSPGPTVSPVQPLRPISPTATAGYGPPMAVQPVQTPLRPGPQFFGHPGIPVRPAGGPIPQLSPVQPPVQPLVQPPGQPFVQPNIYTKGVAAVAKVYTDDDKYTGIDDSFDFKLSIFQDICNRSGVPPDAYMAAFPIMLKGLAQAHYYNSSLSTKPYEAACTHIRNFFEGPEYYRKNLAEWNATHLQDLINTHPEKPIGECLRLLIDKLLKLQYGIDVDLRTPKLFANKLVTACQGVPACRIAISDPPGELSTLINKLQSSITAWEKENPRITSASYFTDRRYYHGLQQRRIQPKGRFTARNGPRKAHCYICRKEDCRSWKHTDAERQKAKDNWKGKFNARTGGRFASQSNDKFNQYITIYEDSDDDTDIDDVFESLVIDIEREDRTTPMDDPTPVAGTNDDLIASYHMSIGDLSPANAAVMVEGLATKAFTHFLDPQADIASYVLSASDRYGPDTFMGIVVDTGASTKSTAGYGQFQALQRSIPGLELNTTTQGQVNVQFGVGCASSMGNITVRTPIGNVQFHIVEPNTPFLLCLADMDSLQVYFDNVQDLLVTPIGTVPVVRRFGHAFLLFDSALRSYLVESFDLQPCYLTEIELRRLHRRFGHPSVDRLEKLLDRTGQKDDNTRAVLEHLAKYCHFCQKHGRSPGRFRFTLRDDVEFNYNIIVDIMYISASPILHVVDEATRFQTGRWLDNITAKHTWETLQACWIDTYLGPPDNITTDAGKNFISKEFREYASTFGIRTKAVPVEAHNSIGIVERYHGPIRRIYQIVRMELPDITKEMALQTTFKAINDTAGPDGLIPTLLVFGAYPRMTESSAPAATVAQRTVAINKAMAEVRKLRTERQIIEALRTRNGPRVDGVHDLPINSDVLVWREGNTNQLGHWDGPYKLLTVEGETVTVQIENSPTAFRSTVVKPYFQDQQGDSGPITPNWEGPTPVPASVQPLRPQAGGRRGYGPYGAVSVFQFVYGPCRAVSSLYTYLRPFRPYDCHLRLTISFVYCVPICFKAIAYRK